MSTDYEKYDNLRLKGKGDGSKISVTEPWEVIYWSHKWDVSPERLVKACKEIGGNHSVEKVRKVLGK